jgi:putative membrane protein
MILALLTGLVLTSAQAATGEAQVILPKMNTINTMEIEAGQLGADKACDADVKAFGAQMVTDHTANNAQVTALATAHASDLNAVAFSAEEQAQIDEQKQTVEDLKTITDCSFDKAFLQSMIDAHEFAIGVVTEASTATPDTDVLDYLKTTLPTLQDHKQMATDLLNGLDEDQE